MSARTHAGYGAPGSPTENPFFFAASDLTLLGLPGATSISNGNCYEDKVYDTFFWVIGLPYPALMGAIAFVVTLVPLFGSVIFWLLATIAALFTSPLQALIFAIAYLIYMQVESYVVSPRVLGKVSAIPASLVLIGALVGGTLLGIAGVLLALPVMITALLVLREIVVPRQDAKVHRPAHE